MNSPNKLATGTAGPAFNYGYVMVAAAFVIVMLSVGLFVSVGVFFKPIIEDFNWSRGVTSGALSVGIMVSGLVNVIAGSLSDKFGPRLTLTGVVFVAGVGYLLMSTISSIWQIYVYFGLLCAIGNSVQVPLVSSISRWFPTKRTLIMGIIFAGGGVGGLFIPLLSDKLITLLDWPMSYRILGGAFLVLAVIAAQFLRNRPNPYITASVQPEIKSNPGSSSDSSTALPLKQVFKMPNLWLGILIFFFFGVCVLTVQLHVVNHATDINIDSTAAASILSILNGCSIIGSIFLGTLGDKFGNQKVMSVSFLVMAACMLSLTVISSYWQLAVFGVLFGISLGSGLSNMPALVSKLFGFAYLGFILGIVNLGQTVGGSLGGYLAGAIFDAQDSYRTIFLICTILCMLGFIATLLIKARKKTPVASSH
jgi:MFS family permease